jgi:hypothetical protein
MNTDDVRDPWRRRYVLRCDPANEKHAFVISAGPDNVFGTEDDIRSDATSDR